jgi:hypothetical protein
VPTGGMARRLDHSDIAENTTGPTDQNTATDGVTALQ